MHSCSNRLSFGRNLVLAVFFMLPCSASQAQGTLAYSFESDLQGFGPNGFGVAITQDTIGATEGTKSMKMDLTQGATYVGALTGDINPLIGNPPGVDFVNFDLTLTSVFPEEGFVDIFIVFFGVKQGTTEPGLESSFQENRFAIGDLGIGTHKIEMQLDMGIDPINFVFGTFDEIFGQDPNDLIPTGFQITVNKSTQAPWVGYIDNVRVGQNSASQPGDFDNDGDVDGHDFLVWQRGGTTPPLDATLLNQWQTNYGAGGVLLTGIAAVPEPSGVLLLLTGLGSLLALNRKFSGR